MDPRTTDPRLSLHSQRGVRFTAAPNTEHVYLHGDDQLLQLVSDSASKSVCQITLKRNKNADLTDNHFHSRNDISLLFTLLPS